MGWAWYKNNLSWGGASIEAPASDWGPRFEAPNFIRTLSGVKRWRVHAGSAQWPLIYLDFNTHGACISPAHVIDNALWIPSWSDIIVHHLLLLDACWVLTAPHSKPLRGIADRSALHVVCVMGCPVEALEGDTSGVVGAYRVSYSFEFAFHVHILCSSIEFTPCV